MERKIHCRGKMKRTDRKIWRGDKGNGKKDKKDGNGKKYKEGRYWEWKEICRGKILKRKEIYRGKILGTERNI